ncbi:MAG TPA: SMP-30/gluconolactonase/LRE family protein [Pirellulales bacterium]|jgi:gluconolactonase|nr:SMP-30/gluconolactonase/LRE family protein [Pirellulales bacterium]
MNCTLAIALLLTGVAGGTDLPPPSGEQIVAPEARLELLFTRTAAIHGGLTEGPAAAPDGSIYFSDIPEGADRGMILRWDPRSRTTTVFTDDSHKSNGLAFDPQGNLVACEGADEGGRAIVRWDIQTKQRTVLADRYQGKRFNAPNDLCIDHLGRIYFTDPKYLGSEPRELEHRAVYRIDPSGEVVEVTHEVSKPNGIALGLDERVLYVAEHDNGTDRIGAGDSPPKPGAMRIEAFALRPDGLVSKHLPPVVDFGSRKGCDGMTVDRQGHLLLTVRDPARPGVLVVDTQGRELGFIPTGPVNQTDKNPIGLPSNVEFGRGQEAKTLYITVDRSLYRIPLRIEGAK